MPCYSPIKCHRNDAGDVIFNAKQAIGGADSPMTVPCGQCLGCRMKRRRDWAIRCTHEAQMHKKNAFITLTYNNANLPPDHGLHIEHWQLFAKKLRSRIGPFRFFHCGEYGKKNLRPHYHALIFGEDFSFDSAPLKQSAHQSTGPQNQNLRLSSTVYDAWTTHDKVSRGFHSIGTVNFKSASYVASYCTAKRTGLLADEAYSRTDRATGEVHKVRPEYATMSLKPGIGSTWFERYMDDVYPSNEVVLNGQAFTPPAYYDKKLKETDALQHDEMKLQRFNHQQGQEWNQTPARLKVRETVARARMTQNSNGSL